MRRHRMRVMKRVAFVRFSLLFAVLGCVAAASETPLAPVPAPADERVAVTQVRVRPDRPGWTYAPGEKVKFHVEVVWDQQPLPGATVRYSVGPEMMPARENTAIVPDGGLVIDGGTLSEPGFIRCVVTTKIAGKTYRGLATAGFAPERIVATQQEPADFDDFWSAGLKELAAIPLEPRLELIPEASTGAINVYHVSFRTWHINPTSARVYGILCEPKAPGKYPAILRVPGAGVRPYAGQRALAEAGAITLEIGVHGIPVNLPQEIYDQLRSTALFGYPRFNLDDKESYYFRRVYLGCVRANDFLTTRPAWDGKNLVVNGASQGGLLALVTGALDPRVTAVSSVVPAYCDVTGYLHGRAGGWPHTLRTADGPNRTPAKIATTAYYDAVNFAKRVRVPTHVVLGYNDETCPPTSIYSMWNALQAPKTLLLALEMGHSVIPEANDAINAWVLERAGVTKR